MKREDRLQSSLLVIARNNNVRSSIVPKHEGINVAKMAVDVNSVLHDVRCYSNPPGYWLSFDG